MTTLLAQVQAAAELGKRATDRPWTCVPNPMRTDGVFLCHGPTDRHYHGQLPEGVCSGQIKRQDANYIAAAANLPLPAIAARLADADRFEEALKKIADTENPEHYGNARDALHSVRLLAEDALTPPAKEAPDA